MHDLLSTSLVKSALLVGFACLWIEGCTYSRPEPATIEFTRLPPTGQGSPDILHNIEGRVKGARHGQKVVIFARSGMWWVQPLADQPFTTIQTDSTWKTVTHPGSAYAALLVDSSYRPPATVNLLPAKGGAVAAVATADGLVLEQAPSKRLDFSGYQWEVRQTPGMPGGMRNEYNPANAWVDRQGYLHLAIRKTPSGWSSAEIWLTRSLGYGSYRFHVRDISHLEPSAVLTIASWDSSAPSREMDIEISRWGESSGRNAQYVVQPYYVPANVVRFLSPPGPLVYSFDWSAGRVTFRTGRGGNAVPLATHVFTSGVPAAGGETIHFNLYNFNDRNAPLRNGVEVIIEKFEYLP